MFVTYFSNRHGISLTHPASWRSEQQEQDGVWYRSFLAPPKASAREAELSATLFVAPFTNDLDSYAQTYMAGQPPTAITEEKRPGLAGRSYRFDGKDAATRHHLLILVAETTPAAVIQPASVFGLYVQGRTATFRAEEPTIEAMLASFSLERAALYPERRNPAYTVALRVPGSWKAERSLSGGETFLAQYRSPAFVVEKNGRTAHASLTLAVQKVPGVGDLEAYYKSIRQSLGDPFPVLSHEPWNGGYADLMRTETPVSEQRIKRYYRVAGGRGYSLTCEAREDVFARMDRWCDIIASSLRVGNEVGGS